MKTVTIPRKLPLVMGKTVEQVKSIFVNFERKYKTTEYLRMGPIRD